MIDQLGDSARVWVYQSSRAFTEVETAELNQDLGAFARDWTAHNQHLRAAGEVVHDRFLVLAVDESQAGASGCSIDKSVHFIQEIESRYGTQLFDRMRFAYRFGGEIRTAGLDEMKGLYESGGIDDETVYFNNLVEDMGAFRREWMQPIGESKLKRFLV